MFFLGDFVAILSRSRMYLNAFSASSWEKLGDRSRVLHNCPGDLFYFCLYLGLA